MYLCPKDTNFFAHFDELLLFCVDQTIGPFTNTVWIDTRNIEKWKRVEKSNLPPTSNGPILMISVRYMRKV